MIYLVSVLLFISPWCMISLLMSAPIIVPYWILRWLRRRLTLGYKHMSYINKKWICICKPSHGDKC